MATQPKQTSLSKRDDARPIATDALTVQPGTESPELRSARVAAALRLLDEWMADESGYDEAAWPELRAALDRDRLSSRRLFSG